MLKTDSKGIDVSEWQSGINYDDVVNSGIEFAIIRVGYGVSYAPSDQRDKEFDNHYNGFKSKIPVGAYYYAYSTNYEEGRKEAENCLAYIGDKTFELPIYYDVEENRNSPDGARGFIDRIREAGLKAGFYTYTSMYIDKGFVGIDCDSLWLAEFGANDGQVPSVKPAFSYDIWQYTSRGYVPGISGNVDMNITGNPTPTPEPQPTDRKVAEIQETLNARYGLHIAVDNIAGSETNWALVYGLQTEMNIQFGTGIKVDGIFGDETYSHAIEIYPGANGNMTWIIRSSLICLGYDLQIGYSYDSDMERAVSTFQRENYLDVDFIVGQNTQWELFA